MKILNLGCGNKIIEGAVNHDVSFHRDDIDMVFDLNIIPYPLKDDEWDEIIMLSVIEHLIPTPLETLNELWRIVKPYGFLKLKFPLPISPTFHDDLTHRWKNTIKAYEVVDPRTTTGQSYGFYTPFKWHIISRVTHKNLSAHLTLQKIIAG